MDDDDHVQPLRWAMATTRVRHYNDHVNNMLHPHSTVNTSFCIDRACLRRYCTSYGGIGQAGRWRPQEYATTMIREFAYHCSGVLLWSPSSRLLDLLAGAVLYFYKS